MNKKQCKKARGKFKKAYKILLGRNKYSQALRNYVYKKYKDGKYYSDCSSSYCEAMKKAGVDIGLTNTVGLFHHKKAKKIDANVKNGIPDYRKLKVGDAILFAGTDKSRASSNYVGHVEAVYKIDKETGEVTLCGHGSGTPSLKNMKTYCKYRKKIGVGEYKGVVGVRRFIFAEKAEKSGKANEVSA